MRKYGSSCFQLSVVYQSKDRDHIINVMEPYFIKVLDSFCGNGNGYNMTLGGEGGYGRIVSSAVKSHLHDIQTAQRDKISSGLRSHYRIIYPTGKTEDIDDLRVFCKTTGSHRQVLQRSAYSGKPLKKGKWKGCLVQETYQGARKHSIPGL